MNRKNIGFKWIFCVLSIGVTLGYIAAKLMDKLDYHIVCMGKGSKRPPFFQHCCDDDAEECDCGADANNAEPYAKPLDDDATHCDEP